MQFLCTVHITRARARAYPILGMTFMPHSISYLRYLTLRPYDTYIARYHIGQACKRRHGVLCTPLLQVSTLITYLIAIIHTNMQHALATWPSWPHYSPESLPLRRPRHRFSVQEILHAKKKTVLLLEGEAKPISELLVRAGVERRHLGEALFPSPRAIMSPKSAKVSFFGDLWLSANPRQRHPKTATLQPFWSKTAERNSQCEATTCGYSSGRSLTDSSDDSELD